MRRDRYTMNIDRKRNCYSYGGFGHLARNCRNWGLVSQKRRIGYKDNLYNTKNLKEEENLVVLN